MALKFSLPVDGEECEAAEEFGGCFGDDVAKNRGLAPLKSTEDEDVAEAFLPEVEAPPPTADAELPETLFGEPMEVDDTLGL